MSFANSRILFQERPVGQYVPEKTFKKDVQRFTANDVPNGSVLVKIIYLSLDPAMRGWMNDARSYIAPVKIGDVMRGSAVGRVIISKNSRFPVGTLVQGLMGWQEYYISKEGDDLSVVKLVHPKLRIIDAIAALGGTGLTAYFGMYDVGKPKPGDTVVVSGAAGATGSVAGQLAKIAVGPTGKVIGIAGSADKCRWLVEELGFDAAINYKDKDFAAQLRKHTPKFINVFFDNVGGSILDACLGRLATYGRVVLCGAISQYNAVMPSKTSDATTKQQVAVGPANYMTLITQRGTMQGFIVFDYKERFGEAVKFLAKAIVEGKLKSQETVVEGLENAPEALKKLFEGANTGKMLVQVAPEDSGVLAKL